MFSDETAFTSEESLVMCNFEDKSRSALNFQNMIWIWFKLTYWNNFIVFIANYLLDTHKVIFYNVINIL